jgi:hypothetical protein
LLLRREAVPREFVFGGAFAEAEEEAGEGGRESKARRSTRRAEGRLKPDIWEIVRREDGSFDMFHKGALVHSAIPDRWLEDQVGEHGFCGQEYLNIRRQLDESGKATISL